MEPLRLLYPADIWYLIALTAVLTLMLPVWLGVVLCTFVLVAWYNRRVKSRMRQDDHPR
jgi:hypothetical protein